MLLHGHSHVNMNPTPSSVDMTFRNQHIQNVSNEKFMIYLIVNLKEDYTIEIYDKRTKVIWETMDVTINIGDPKSLEKAITWAKSMIKENVKEAKQKPWTPQSFQLYGNQYAHSRSMSSAAELSGAMSGRLLQGWD